MAPEAPTHDAPDPADVEAIGRARAIVLARIASAAQRSGRDPDAIRLVAVTKTVPAERLRAAMAAGLDLFGENRVQEAAGKIPVLPGGRWHLIGPLQANKARRAIELFDLVETVDSMALAERLDRLVRAVGWSPEASPAPRPRRLPVLLQVNVDADPAKAGYDPERLAADLPALLRLDALSVRGLMTVGRLVDDAEAARPTFRRLRELRDRLLAANPAMGSELSMGMSADYPVAVEEGATIVRVGQALFGARPPGAAPG
jgi:pyridoxal phosphate enzyme (YggS family)